MKERERGERENEILDPKHDESFSSNRKICFKQQPCCCRCCVADAQQPRCATQSIAEYLLRLFQSRLCCLQRLIVCRSLSLSLASAVRTVSEFASVSHTATAAERRHGLVENTGRSSSSTCKPVCQDKGNCGAAAISCSHCCCCCYCCCGQFLGLDPCLLLTAVLADADAAACFAVSQT